MADPTSLPPDILAQIAARRLGFNQAADIGRQKENQGFSDNLFNIGQFKDDTQKKINNNYAASGLFNSGLRVDEQGRLVKNVDQQIGSLNAQHANNLAGIDNSLTQQLQDLDTWQSQQANAYTAQQTQQSLLDAQNQANALQQQLAGQQPIAAPAAQDPGAIDWNAIYKIFGDGSQPQGGGMGEMAPMPPPNNNSGMGNMQPKIKSPSSFFRVF